MLVGLTRRHEFPRIHRTDSSKHKDPTRSELSDISNRALQKRRNLGHETRVVISPASVYRIIRRYNKIELPTSAREAA